MSDAKRERLVQALAVMDDLQTLARCRHGYDGSGDGDADSRDEGTTDEPGGDTVLVSPATPDGVRHEAPVQNEANPADMDTGTDVADGYERSSRKIEPVTAAKIAQWAREAAAAVERRPGDGL